MNRKGVFGLTSVQQFFAIILGITLLAYVIIVIMGTLSNSSILPSSTENAVVTNETSWLNTTTYTLATISVSGFSNPVLNQLLNTTDGKVINSANFTLSASGVLAPTATANLNWSTTKISYNYSFNNNVRQGANNILANTSIGVTSFFSSINPVYAILAILVIILILVVLVRVVTGGSSISGQSREPSL